MSTLTQLAERGEDERKGKGAGSSVPPPLVRRVIYWQYTEMYFVHTRSFCLTVT